MGGALPVKPRLPLIPTCFTMSCSRSLLSSRLIFSISTRYNPLKGTSFVRFYGLVSPSWERKRFYKQATIYQCEDGGFGVKLDHRNLRTPQRKIFSVPFEPLAAAVCHEWQAQEKLIRPSLMHLTALCNTVIDSPTSVEIGQVLQYLSTDTVCFRATEPEELVELQEREWDPIITWFNKRYDCQIQPTTGLSVLPLTNDLKESMTLFVKSLGKWGETGFNFALDSTKSLVLTCALFDGHVDPKTVSELSRLEVRHQTSKWGSVEWQHDIEAQDLLSRLSASLLLHQLTVNRFEESEAWNSSISTSSSSSGC